MRFASAMIVKSAVCVLSIWTTAWSLEAAATPIGQASSCPMIFRTSVKTPAVSVFKSQGQPSDFKQLESDLQAALLRKTAAGKNHFKITINELQAQSMGGVARAISLALESVSPDRQLRVEVVVYSRDVESLLESSSRLSHLATNRQIRYRFEILDMTDARQIRRIEFERPDVSLNFGSYEPLSQ